MLLGPWNVKLFWLYPTLDPAHLATVLWNLFSRLVDLGTLPGGQLVRRLS